MKKSAGVLVYRKKNNKIEILLVHPGGPYWQNKDENCWSIPKGEITLIDDVPLSSSAEVVNLDSQFVSLDAPVWQSIVPLDLSPEVTQPGLGFHQSSRRNKPRETNTTDYARRNRDHHAETNLGKQINIRKNSQTFAKIIKETAIREFEEETGLKINEEDKEKIFYLGEVRSSNKILYVFVLEKDFGDNFEIISNFIEIECPPKSGKIIKIPEVDKGGYFDLETAKKKLVNYQKEIVDKLEKLF